MEENKQAQACSAKHTLYMPVYTIQEGLHIGNVKMIVIDPKEKSVIALITERRKMSREEKIIPIQSVTSIGEDAITIDKLAYAEKRTNNMEKPNLAKIMLQLRQPIHIMGSRIFTIGGKTLGRVEDFSFDPQGGLITSLEVSDGSLLKEKLAIEGDYIITIAPNTIMLSDGALSTMKTVENNLLSTMGMAKNKANSAFEAAGKFSKNIGKSINRTEKQAEEKNEQDEAEKALVIEIDSVNMNSEATVEVSIEVEQNAKTATESMPTNLPTGDEKIVFVEDVEDFETILTREIMEDNRNNESDGFDQDPLIVFIGEDGKEIQPQTKINFVSMKENKIKNVIKTPEKVPQKPQEAIIQSKAEDQQEPLPQTESNLNNVNSETVFMENQPNPSDQHESVITTPQSNLNQGPPATSKETNQKEENIIFLQTLDHIDPEKKEEPIATNIIKEQIAPSEPKIQIETLDSNGLQETNSDFTGNDEKTIPQQTEAENA